MDSEPGIMAVDKQRVEKLVCVALKGTNSNSLDFAFCVLLKKTVTLKKQFDISEIADSVLQGRQQRYVYSMIILPTALQSTVHPGDQT